MMLSRSSISEPADLGKTIVVALIIVIVVAGDVNRRLCTGQDLLEEGEIVVVGIRDLSVLWKIGVASRRK